MVTIYYTVEYLDNFFRVHVCLSIYRAVVRTGATGAIAPVDFWKEALIAAVVQNSIYILAPMDLNF